MKHMTVRAATAADIPAVLELVRSYWEFEGIGGFDAARTARVLQQLSDDSPYGAMWVATHDATLSGYLIVVLVMSVEHQGLMGEIDEFFVQPQARSHGIGAQLLAAAETDLKRRGGVRLQLQIGAVNARGRAFYERHGYALRAGYELLDKQLT
jgi:GNAT superfamily N-acetyltransferase